MNEDTDAHWVKDASLPEYGPPDDIYRLAVPIWCGRSHRDLAEDIGPEYGCGFADGFQQGIVMAMHRPEWAQGFYHDLREYYLTTHTEQDLCDWERYVEETARTIPMERDSTAGSASETRDAQE